jgi:desulfoferrodoxin (superoxide reductase-like protein)
MLIVFLNYYSVNINTDTHRIQATELVLSSKYVERANGTPHNTSRCLFTVRCARSGMMWSRALW